MKTINKRIISIFLTVTASFTFTACEDSFLDQEVKSLIGPDVIYTNLEGLEAGLNGLYSKVRYQRGGDGDASSNHLRMSHMISGTDIAYANRRVAGEAYLNEWGSQLLATASRNRLNFIWDWCYEVIASSNQIIDRTELLGTDVISDADKNRVIAEARMIRAWAYRHLTFLFGDVPLNTAEVKEPRFDWLRQPVSEVRDQIQMDLEYAIEHLPEEHLNDGKVIKAVAQHYLTELLIVKEDYAGAISVAQAAINGPRALITERFGVAADQPGTVFSDIFKDGNANPSEGNTEALWVFQNDLELREAGGDGGNIMRRWFGSEYSIASGNGPNLALSVERGGRGITRQSATTFQINLYRDENGNVIDERGDGYAWRNYFIINQDDIDQNAVSDTTYVYDGDTLMLGDTLFMDATSIEREDDRMRPYPRKWDWTHEANLAESRNFNDLIHLRLADTYLLLAEAQFKNGDASAAAETINVLRRRANAPEVGPGDIDIDYILDERARELYTEEERRYTLLRNNKWVERTNLHNSIASGKIDPERDILYPIPQDFIDSNIEVDNENNPGY